MGHNQKINLPSAGSLLDRLRMGGKKAAVAGGLLVVMLLMWVRVFIGPKSAAAAPPGPQPTQTRPGPAPVQVQFLDLPKLPGRHDSLEWDFFATREGVYSRRNSADRKTGTETEVPVVTWNSSQEVVQRIAKTLKLKAVWWSKSPQALIGDQSLGVGDKLTVKNNAETLEFEVVQICVDSVLVECAGQQARLELARSLEMNK